MLPAMIFSQLICLFLLLRSERAHYLAWMVGAKYIPVSTVLALEEKSEDFFSLVKDIIKKRLIRELPQQSALIHEVITSTRNLYPTFNSSKALEAFVSKYVSFVKPQTVNVHQHEFEYVPIGEDLC